MKNKYVATLIYYIQLWVEKILLIIRYYLSSKNLVINKDKCLIKFNNDGDDQELLYIVNWDKYYNEEFPKLNNLINKGENVIDVGANLGFFALMISNLVGNSGKVFCFEPSRIVYNKLINNLNLNHINNVITENMGLGEKDGQKILKRNKKYSGMSSIILEQDGDVVEEKINISSIDKYFINKNLKIKLIKIDTEGFEPQVLKGALNLIKSQQPIIYIELGGGKFLKSSIEALNILLQNEYTLSVTVEELKRIKSGTNFVALPKREIKNHNLFN